MNHKRSPRVLIVSRQFRPMVGGAEKQVERLAGEFVQKGLTVRVIAGRFDPSWPRHERLPNGLEIVRLPSPRFRAVGTAIFLMSLFFYIIRHRHDYDIVHTQHAHYGAMGSVLAAKLIKKPVVCKIAGSGKTGDVAALKRTPLRSFLLKILKRIDRFVTVSRETQRELQEAGFEEKQIALIPNGVDTEFFCPPSREQRSNKNTVDSTKILLYVGRIAQEKGLDILLRAVSLLPRSYELKLRVLGNGPLWEEMQALVAHLGISDQVEFLGEVENVREHLQSADMFVLPSRFEGLSNALLEAMACGLPVVATKTSGTVDVLRHGENGLLVDVEDPKALAAAIEQLLQETSLAQKLAENAIQTVRMNYSLDSVAERYIALYRELIHEHA